ncbi:MAG: hypothetical protein RL215_1470 [Planctomycetota bacterium]
MSVCAGEAGVDGGGGCGGDSGYDFEGDTGVVECGRFFAPASEDVGVTAFESHDLFTESGFVDESRVDEFLWDDGLSGSADASGPFAGSFGEFEEEWVNESVVEDEVGLCEELCAADGDESGVTGTCADEPDFADGGLFRRVIGAVGGCWHHRRSLRWK